MSDDGILPFAVDAVDEPAEREPPTARPEPDLFADLEPADETAEIGPSPLPELDGRSRAWATIDLGALERNFRFLRERLPDHTRFLAVLKSDAYGHGASILAPRLVELGVDMLGVGDSSEALELRELGLECPLLILGAIVPGEMEDVVQHGISTCIHTVERSELLSEVARALGRPARVHLKVDTGMGRLGVLPRVARRLAVKLHRDRWLEFEGICTHYGSAASPVPFHTAEQLAQFVRLLEELRAAGIDPPYVHASNSAAVFSTLGSHFSMVRVGLALLGLNPGNFPLGTPPVEPVLSLRTQIVFMKDLPPSAPVGYNRTHVNRRETRIAVLPVGYADGIPYALSNRGHVLIRGQRAPMIGAISMDYTTIDVSDIEDVAVGDEVTIVGVDGKRRITVEDIARTIGTIPYEITSRLGRRVARLGLEG